LGLMDKILSFMGAKDKGQIDYDYKNDQVLYKDTIISYVKDELERRKQERAPLELMWRLISNFVSGDQYCDINPYTMEIEDIEKAYDWMQRETFNRMAPIYEARLSKLSQIRPLMRCRPSTNEIDDIAKAKISTAVLKGTQIRNKFFEKLDTANAWMDLLGTVFFISGWNPSKGKVIYREEVVVVEGEEVKKKVNEIREGDLDFGILTPFEVYPDSILNQELSDCRSIIIEQVMPVDKIYDIFGIRVPGRNISVYGINPVLTAGGLGYETTVNTLALQEREDAETVTTYMELPSRDYPDGRTIIIVGETELVYYGGLAYNVGEDNTPSYPLVKTVAIKKPGCFFGTSVYERMLPVQRAYNAIKNRKHDFLNRCVIQAYSYEEGSIDETRLEEEGISPGSVWPRRPGTPPPQPINNGNLPGEFINEEDRLIREMEYLSGLSELSITSTAPSGLRSAKALESLKQTDDTRLSRTAEQIRASAIELSKQWLRIFKQYAKTPRVIKFTGTNEIANVFWWSASDITDYDVVHETENELNDTLEQRREFVVQLLQVGAFNNENGVMDRRAKQKLFELFKFGNWEDAIDIDELHIARAQRENAYFQAGVMPQLEPYDNDEMHAQEHDRLILSTDFEVLKQTKPELAQIFIAHRYEHEMRMQQKAMDMQQQQIMQMKEMGQRQWLKNMKQNAVKG